MPWASAESNSEYYQPQAAGPVMLTTPLWAAGNAPPATIAVAGTWDSGLLTGDGYKVLSVGVTSSLTGTLTITRYIDTAGLVQQGAASSASLTAGTAAVLNVTDNLPYATWRIKIANTGGGTTTLTNFAALMTAS